MFLLGMYIVSGLPSIAGCVGLRKTELVKDVAPFYSTGADRRIKPGKAGQLRFRYSLRFDISSFFSLGSNIMVA
ncbi:hypothetical protein B0H65DRAFT_9790 [Neurospora tetraspora]|uniref:Uncharacterized protein n=1 Tax=Neurospora tetraspora TaxID=94610 RepID=A0AAE0JMJ6_9PEZI|nr:hypothetical protein B0H65DRAFT_9790 [Neurospora tetraspora]